MLKYKYSRWQPKNIYKFKQAPSDSFFKHVCMVADIYDMCFLHVCSLQVLMGCHIHICYNFFSTHIYSTCSYDNRWTPSRIMLPVQLSTSQKKKEKIIFVCFMQRFVRKLLWNWKPQAQGHSDRKLWCSMFLRQYIIWPLYFRCSHQSLLQTTDCTTVQIIASQDFSINING